MLLVNKREPEKINRLPEDIQKLVWRAFFYISQIENYLDKCACRWDNLPAKKLYKYCEAVENLERIIEKKCRQKGMEEVVICYDERCNHHNKS